MPTQPARFLLPVHAWLVLVAAFLLAGSGIGLDPIEAAVSTRCGVK